MNKKTIEIKERNLALEAVRVTEAAALSASSWIGLGDEKKADAAAVKAMRESLNALDIDGEVVIGEGERDKAPMLYIGEKVGTQKGPQVDIALDPLEGTTICATGGNNALTVIAFSEKGGFLNAPDVYMDKIAVGGNLPKGIIDIDEKPEINIKNLAKVLKKEVNDIVVCILDRPRHKNIIEKCRNVGARIMFDERALFNDQWKLHSAKSVLFPVPASYQLFNIIEDPFEQNDLAEEEPEIFNAMKKTITSYIERDVVGNLNPAHGYLHGDNEQGGVEIGSPWLDGGYELNNPPSLVSSIFIFLWILIDI